MFSLFHSDFPGVDRAGLGGDVDADLDELLCDRSGFIVIRSSLKPVWNQVPFLIDLLERFLCGSVHLELKDVDPVFGSADGIRPADGGLYLGLGVVAKQRENQVDDRLKMLLGLVLQVVRYPGEKGFHSFQRPVDVIVLQRLVELEHK